MDALSDLLRSMRLTGAVFLESRLPSQWRYVTPSADMIREQLIPGERVIAFHLVVEGSCAAWLPGEAPFELRAGELVLFPHGDSHHLASSISEIENFKPTQVRCESLRSISARREADDERANTGLGTTRMICGYIACGGYNSLSVLADLPQVLRVQGDSQLTAWLESSMKFCLVECNSEQPGSSLVVEKVAELMLVQAIRHHINSRESACGSSRFVSIKDRYVRKAVTLIHGDPAHAWNVAELSRLVGLSRSALAGRFVTHFGEPPMQYVARRRISLAADALLSTNHGLVQIASNVGYESEAAFNRAFKREYGLPPAAWRKQAASQSQLKH